MPVQGILKLQVLMQAAYEANHSGANPAGLENFVNPDITSQRLFDSLSGELIHTDSPDGVTGVHLLHIPMDIHLQQEAARESVP